MTKKNVISKLLPSLLIAGALFFLFYTSVLIPAFGPNTCGSSEEDLAEFILDYQQNNAAILKTAENGRIKAAIFQRDDIGTCIAMFERKLFGLRWSYDGMDMLRDPEDGLGVNGAWSADDKCYVVVSGDNRGGLVATYRFPDEDGLARDNLEADYIIDIYVLDGIDHFPERTTFQQFTSDGTPVGEGYWH